jgi:hypothetical protein
MRSWASRLFLCAAALAWGACRPREEAVAPAFPPGKVWIVAPAASNGFARAAAPVLDALLPGAPRADWQGAPAAFRRCLAESNVVVIADAANAPVASWDAIRRFLHDGGAAVFWGCRPFENRASEAGSRTIPGTGQAAALARDARSLPLPEIHSWRRRNDTGRLGGAVRMDRIPGVAWPAVSVEVERLDRWDALSADVAAEDAIPEDVRALVFHARADPETPRLVVECEEEDGTRWAHVVELSEEWEPRCVDASSFRHAGGGEGRGGPGDRLVLARVRRISLGLRMDLTPQSPGRHVFGVSTPKGVAASEPPAIAEPLPAIPGVSPQEQRYTMNAVRVVIPETRKAFAAAGTMESCLPRSRGTGGTLGVPGRWIPLAEAFDAGGECRGWPASVHVEMPGDGPIRQWAWVGLDPAADNRELAGELLRACVGRLLAGHYLYRTGCDRHAFGPGESMAVHACYESGFARNEGLRVAAELIDERSTVQRRVVRSLEPVDGTAARPVRIDLGAAPAAVSVPRTVTVRVQVEDLGGRASLDSVEQTVLLLPAAPAREARAITVAGADFRLDRSPLFLLGMNYAPVASASGGGCSPAPHWLHPSAFDLMTLRGDLERLRQAGINALAVEYREEPEAPQLRALVEEARRSDQWIVLHLPCLDPLAQDLEKARRMIEAAGLAGERRVFALELAREPLLGPEKERRALDPEWEAWLAAQFGSVEHAESVLGTSLWRRDGRLTGPPDRALEQDGDHRAAVEVYRRFVDDRASRAYGATRRFLAGLGCEQLLTARHGAGGTGQPQADQLLPLEPATGAAHFDFLSVVAWGLFGSGQDTAGASFITAYARGVSGGKPVVWLKAGCPAGRQPREADLRNQSRVYGNIVDMALRSRSAGLFGWVYPGGILPGEDMDLGVVGPDGAWREAGGVFKNAARRLRSFRSPLPPWRGRTFDRAADARGLSALWDAWRETCGSELAAGKMEEAKPVGYGAQSREIDVWAAGGVRYVAPAPMALVNAEWGGADVGGRPVLRGPGASVEAPVRQPVRLELINTGAAAWSSHDPVRPGTTFVKAVRLAGGEDIVDLKDVRPGGRAVVEWIPPDPGAWTLRPWLNRIGGFGEALTVHVSPAPAAP